MNRFERRAIANGKGRTNPMIEIFDPESAEEYAFCLSHWECTERILNNINRMFISHQLSYLDTTDAFVAEPCLLY